MKMTICSQLAKSTKMWLGKDLIIFKFHLTSVKLTGEQCSNKWKKLEEKYKKVGEHNNRTGNDRKECYFQQ